MKGKEDRIFTSYVWLLTTEKREQTISEDIQIKSDLKELEGLGNK